MKKSIITLLVSFAFVSFAHQSTFYQFVRYGTPEQIREVIASGVIDVNAPDALGFTPLMHATRNPNPDLITVLVEAGADVHAITPEGHTSLILAARDAQNPEVISRLLELGVEPNIRDQAGRIALYYGRMNNAVLNSPALVQLYRARQEELMQEPLRLAMPASATGIITCVDLNTASRDELRQIIHIDEMRSSEIIRLRTQRPFRSVSELTRVDGIAFLRLLDIQEQGLACVR